jgi:hypothetical protein
MECRRSAFGGMEFWDHWCSIWLKNKRIITVLTGTGDLDAAVAKHFFDKSNQIGIGTYIDL